MADDPRFIGDPDPEPPAADPKAVRAAAGPKFKRDEAAAGSQRATAAVVVLFLLAVLAAVLVAWALLPGASARPRLLAVHIERYDSPGLPTAAWARADAERLAGAFADPDGRRTAEEDRGLLQGDKLRERLAAVGAGLADPANARRPLVLSVSALGGVTPAGDPCVLPTDADPFNPESWVPLAAVLDALAPPAGGSPPRLLLLDLARPTADPLLGRPAEAAAAAVHRLLADRQAAGTLPCPVLTATAPGEVSLPAPRAGQSAFGLYLADGLLGAAADADGDVTADRLARFVAAGVQRYARTVHGRPQHPQYYTPAGGGDFAIVRATGTPTAPTAEPARPEELAYPAALTARWKQWEGLRDAGAGRDRPEPFAQLTAAVQRAERLWLGTDRAGDADQAAGRAFESWRQEAGGSRPAGRPADDGSDPRSRAARLRLAARPAPAAPPPADLEPALNRYLLARTADPARPDGGQAERQEWAAKAAADPAGAARLAWGRLCGDREPTRATVRVLTEVLADLTRADQPPPLEVALARFLVARSFQQQQGGLLFPADAVTFWLRAEDRLGQALAAGPAGFPRAMGRLDEAERLRQDGAARLFRATVRAEAEAAAELFARAAGLFEQAAAEARAAPRLAEAVPPLVAAVLAFEPVAAAAGGDVLARWEAAVRAAEAALAGSADPATAGRLADEAALAEKRLREAVTPATVEELERRPPGWGKPAEVDRSAALAAGPVLSADLRAKVWGLVRRELALLHDEARKLDAADAEGRSEPPAVATPPDAPPAEGDRRRADTAVALLRLAGGPAGGDVARWWRLEAPAQARRAAADGDRAAAERLLRVVPPAVAAVRDPAAGPGADALSGPAAAARAAYRGWLAEQLRAGYRTPAGAGGPPLWDLIDPTGAVRREANAPD